MPFQLELALLKHGLALVLDGPCRHLGQDFHVDLPVLLLHLVVGVEEVEIPRFLDFCLSPLELNDLSG